MSLIDLLNDFERARRVAERAAALFRDVAWASHLEILESGDLPHLRKRRQAVRENLAHPDLDELERERLMLLLRVLEREIEFLAEHVERNPK